MPLRFVLILPWCIRVCVCVCVFVLRPLLFPFYIFLPFFLDPLQMKFLKSWVKGGRLLFEKIIRETKAGVWRNYESLRGQVSLRGRVR